MSKPQPSADDRLASLRQQIDVADAELVRILARRFALVEQIADIKAARNEPVVVPARIEAVLARVEKLAVEAGLDATVARRLWRAIIDEACALEEAHMRRAPPESQLTSGGVPVPTDIAFDASYVLSLRIEPYLLVRDDGGSLSIDLTE